MANNIITWDESANRRYELGVSKGVIYRKDETGAYTRAEAWNGLTSVSESPEGADNNKIYADNIEYAALRAVETYGCSIEAYTYPDLFEECDGFKELADGVVVCQQTREVFGLSFRTELGSAEKGMDLGYKLHLVYGLTVSPSEKSYESINDSPDAITMSWDAEASPVSVSGMKTTASITIDSTKCDATCLAKLEAALYGSAEKDAYLPLPDEVKTLMTTTLK